MCVFFRGATVSWVVHFFWHHVWLKEYVGFLVTALWHEPCLQRKRLWRKNMSRRNLPRRLWRNLPLPWQSHIHRGEANLLQMPTVLQGRNPWVVWSQRIAVEHMLEFQALWICNHCGLMPWRRLMGSTLPDGQIIWATSRTVGTWLRHCTTSMTQITKRRTRRPTWLLSCPPWSCPLKCNQGQNALRAPLRRLHFGSWGRCSWDSAVLRGQCLR